MEKTIDIDDYINSIIKDNEQYKNIIESLKTEIRTQRQEIALLREERRTILNNDFASEYGDIPDPEWNVSVEDNDSIKLGLNHLS